MLRGWEALVRVSADAAVPSGPEGVALTLRWAVILYPFRPEGFSNSLPPRKNHGIKVCVKRPVRPPSTVGGDFDEDGRKCHSSK